MAGNATLFVSNKIPLVVFLVVLNVTNRHSTCMTMMLFLKVYVRDVVIQADGQPLMEMGTHTAEVDMYLPSKYPFDGARLYSLSHAPGRTAHGVHQECCACSWHSDITNIFIDLTDHIYIQKYEEQRALVSFRLLHRKTFSQIRLLRVL